MNEQPGRLCPVCGGKPSGRPMVFDEVTVLRCRACRHSYSTDVKVPPERIYSSSYFYETHRRYFENPDLFLFELIRKEIESCFSKNARILDIGCGKGTLLRYLRARGFTSLVGIDLVQNEGEGITFLQGDFTQTELAETFDVAVSVMNIEHVQDPRAYVARVRSVLKSGGLFIVTTINEHSLVFGLARLLYRVGVSFAARRLYDPHHLVHFSRFSLTKVVEGGGFSLVRYVSRDRPIKAIDFPPGLFTPVVKGVVFLLSLAARLLGMGFTQTQVFRRDD